MKIIGSKDKPSKETMQWAVEMKEAAERRGMKVAGLTMTDEGWALQMADIILDKNQE